MLLLFVFILGCSNIIIPGDSEYYVANFPGVEYTKFSAQAYGLDGKSRDVRDFIDPDYNPFDEDDPFRLWMKLHEHVSYVRDKEDEWRTPQEMYEGAIGDCEDQAILLASALIAEGYNAYVAIGNTNGSDIVTHAFVVLFLNQKVYYFNETETPIITMELYNSFFRPNFTVCYIFNHEDCWYNTDWGE